ncbi:MAG: carboxypeptidase-like regulatory domain-containing protein, partial [Oscillospiraceae bacterium]|nr:carboxypeptidase-like regulatory domain-containing protein [Oscillospiraceae bacterium]
MEMKLRRIGTFMLALIMLMGVPLTALSAPDADTYSWETYSITDEAVADGDTLLSDQDSDPGTRIQIESEDGDSDLYYNVESEYSDEAQTDASDDDYDDEPETVLPDIGILPANAGDVIIADADDLERFLRGTLGSNSDIFVLADGGNFDMSGRGSFQGRGMDATGQPFTGTFDGNGQTIVGLQLVPRAHGSVDMTEHAFHNNSVGFIRVAGSGARIENLTFNNTSGDIFLDATTTYEWATVQGRSGIVLGRVVAGGAGAVTIENVNFTGNTNMRMNRAGVAAAAGPTTKHIGGFVGAVELGGTLVVNNISMANLEVLNQAGRTHSVGGVIGVTHGQVTITNATINASIMGLTPTSNDNMANAAGGIIGRMEAGNVTINNVSVSGPQIRARQFAGGIVGFTAGGATSTLNMTNVTNEATIVTTHMVGTAAADATRAGGIIGRTGNTVVLTGVTNHANVQHLSNTPTWVGGIIGGTQGHTTINGAWNHGYILHDHPASGHVGGIIGHSAHFLNMTNVHNLGNVRTRGATGTTAATGTAQRQGGIIGLINWPTTGAVAPSAAQRRVTLNNVTNRGNVGNMTITLDNAAARGQLTFDVGGVVGTILHAAQGQVRMYNTTNYGNVRGRRMVGGLVGRSALAGTVANPGLRIRYGMNHGQIISTEGVTGRVGGMIGLSEGAAGLVVERSGNTGMIRSMRGNANAGGSGGIVGRVTGASTVIRESFNAGFISHSGFNGGGIVGRNNGTLLIEDVYNIGQIQAGGSTAAGNRAGSGIVGRRDGGAITLRRAYVSGMWGRGPRAAGHVGTAVGVSATGTGRGVTGFSFSQVYVDMNTAPTTTAAQLQTARTGITTQPTTLLASGLLPGFGPSVRSPIDGQPVWQFGIQDPAPVFNPITEVYDYPENPWATYPYFRWQTGGVLPAPFFDSVIVRASGEPAMDEPVGSASPAIDFTNIHSFDLPFAGAPVGSGGRLFNPYVAPPAVAAGVTIPAEGWFTASPTGNHSVTVPNATLARNEVSMGVISPQGVVGFSGADFGNLIAVTAVDEVTGEFLSHAVLNITNQGPGTVYADSDGVFIAESSRFSAGPGAGATLINITAIGYAPISGHYLTSAQVSQAGRIEIPMTRVPLENIRVWVRDDAGAVLMDPVPVASRTEISWQFISGAWVQQPDGATHTPPRNSNVVATAWFPFTNVMVGDRFEATANGFDEALIYLNAADLRVVSGVANTFEFDIYISDMRNQFPLDIRAWESVNEEGVYSGPIAVGTDVAANRLEIVIIESSMTGIPNPLRVVPNTFRYETRTISKDTVLQIISHNPEFVDSDHFTIGDLIEEIENADGDVTGYLPINIVLAQTHIHEVRVVEEVMMPDGTTIDRLIPNASLHVDDRVAREISVSAVPGSIFHVRAAVGQTLVARAEGFDDGEYLITTDSVDPTRVVLTRETLPPGVIQGFVFDAEFTAVFPGLYIFTPISGASVAVLDANGAPVSGATGTTNTDGFYRIGAVFTPDLDEPGSYIMTGDLPPAIYNVVAGATGFTPNASHHNPIDLEGDGAHADVHLTVDPSGNNSHLLHVTVLGADHDDPGITTTVTLNPTLTRRPGTNVWEHSYNAPLTGTVTARVAEGGFRPDSATVPAAIPGINIHFVILTLVPHDDLPGGRIDGYVRSNTESTPAVFDVPQVGAVVTIITPNGEMIETTTDSFGYFLVYDLDDGDHMVFASMVLPNDRIFFGASVANPVDVEEGETRRANVNFNWQESHNPDSFLLLANIIDDDDDPIIAATASAVRTVGATVTSLASSVARGAGPFWNLGVVAPVASGEAITVSGHALPNFVTNSVQFNGALHLNDAGTIALVPVALDELVIPQNYGVIHGRVTAQDTGAGIAFAAVTIGFPSGTSQTIETDAGGFYSIIVPAGQYNVMASAAGFNFNVSAANPITVLNQGRFAANVVLTRLAGGQDQPFELVVIVGPTTALATANVTHPSVQASDWTRSGNMWLVGTDAALTGNVTVSANGFATRLVPVGQYENNRRTLNVTLETITIPANHGRIHGQVTASNTGLGIVGATVTIGFPNGTSQTVVTGADGFYSINVPVGQYNVRANADGFRGNFSTANPIAVVDQGQHAAN